MHGGPQHGPYYVRYWWRDGRRYKQYVPLHAAAQESATCSARRESERSQREQAEEAHQAWREIRALLREIERGG
jgi:hypothetical protein